MNWRSSPVNRPEQTLIGVQYSTQMSGSNSVPYVVTNSGNWVYAGTGFSDGASVPGIVGYEGDRQFSTYPLPTAVAGTYTLLSHSPYTNTSNQSDYDDASIYEAPSGAWVFASGSDTWSWALDNYGNRNLVDSRIQQVTANILNRFVGSAATPDYSLTASPSSQTVTQGGSTSYSASVNPTGGFTGQVSFTASGLPAGASASFSPNPATSSSTMNITTSSTTPTGTYTVNITGASGTLSHGTSVSLVIAGSGGGGSSQTIAAGKSQTNLNTESSWPGAQNPPYVCCWNQQGQFVTFSFTVNAGPTSFVLRYSAGSGAATRKLELDGSVLAANQTFPATANWSTWSTITLTSTLSAGTHTLKVWFDSTTGSSQYLNLDNLTVNTG